MSAVKASNNAFSAGALPRTQSPGLAGLAYTYSTPPDLLAGFGKGKGQRKGEEKSARKGEMEGKERKGEGMGGERKGREGREGQTPPGQKFWLRPC